jgi:hypothetical protein
MTFLATNSSLTHFNHEDGGSVLLKIWCPPTGLHYTKQHVLNKGFGKNKYILHAQ